MTAALAELLDDGAVYRRTDKGARELVSPSGQLSSEERRFLAIVTGHTPLRVLLDLTGGASVQADTITALYTKGLIALEPSSPAATSRPARA